MIKRIAIFGDVHIGTRQPYFRSAVKVLDWMSKDPIINNEETLLISLGDIYDEETNNGDTNYEVLSFYKKLKNKDKIIIEGNHEKSLREGSALKSLSIIDGVELISEPELRNIEGLNFLFLPHIYTDEKGLSMEERYSNLKYENSIDYCLAHIMDETRQFNKKQKICDLSNLKIKKRIFGHDHNYSLDSGGNYLGSVMPNSSTEKDKKPKIYIIDLETKKDYTIDVPLFINYYTVQYPESLPEINVEFPILNITESLDREESVNYYMNEAKEKGIDLTINRVFRKRFMNDKAEIEDNGKVYTTDLEYYGIFEKEKEVSSGVSTIIRKVIG